MKRVLVLAPHTDDGELGCGASIARSLDEGDDVYYAAFSTAERSVPAGFPNNVLELEVRAATAKLGIKGSNLMIHKYEVRKLNFFRQEILEELVRCKRDIDPDLIFMPSLSDVHQDHHTIAEEGLRAFKTSTILGYELPWNNITFQTQAFIRVDSGQLERKVGALTAYESQAGKPYFSGEFIRSWARTRGVQIGCEFAEAFEAVRWIR